MRLVERSADKEVRSAATGEGAELKGLLSFGPSGVVAISVSMPDGEVTDKDGLLAPSICAVLAFFFDSLSSTVMLMSAMSNETSVCVEVMVEVCSG